MEKLDTAVSDESSAFFLRFAIEKDVDTILQFIRSLAKYENLENEVVLTRENLLDTLFANKYAEVIIAEHRGEPIGFMLFFYNYSTFLGQPGIYLEDLYIVPEARKMGFGKRMLAYLARLAIDRKCGRLEWSCLDWNMSSRRFYEGIGAKSKEEWIGYRLSGPEMQELAGQADQI
jgi:GNAT superfamily N-acetyltransferase